MFRFSQSADFARSHVCGQGGVAPVRSLTTAVTQSSRHCLPLIASPPPLRMLAKLPVQVTCPAAAEDAGEITSAGYLSRVAEDAGEITSAGYLLSSETECNTPADLTIGTVDQDL
jgi:hypothetical protein